MENRYSKRVPIVMDVLLFHNNIPVIHCKTNNIGTDGMFINTDSLNYPTDTILKIEFSKTEKQPTEYFSLPAMVVHQSKSGLGLMLPGGESVPMQEWRKIVKKAITNYVTNTTVIVPLEIKRSDFVDQPTSSGNIISQSR